MNQLMMLAGARRGCLRLLALSASVAVISCSENSPAPDNCVLATSSTTRPSTSVAGMALEAALNDSSSFQVLARWRESALSKSTDQPKTSCVDVRISDVAKTVDETNVVFKDPSRIAGADLCRASSKAKAGIAFNSTDGLLSEVVAGDVTAFGSSEFRVSAQIKLSQLTGSVKLNQLTAPPGFADSDPWLTFILEQHGRGLGGTLVASTSSQDQNDPSSTGGTVLVIADWEQTSSCGISPSDGTTN